MKRHPARSLETAALPALDGLEQCEAEELGCPPQRPVEAQDGEAGPAPGHSGQSAAERRGQKKSP